MENNKKKKKNKKEKKKIVYRTREERQNEVKTIIKQLTEFDLNAKYEPVRDFFKLCKEYVDEDRRIEVNIPFPEINRRIQGLLAISAREECWINLKYEK
tara:strand:+ start:321 stop:617 length:297 start_codon:yes stop_codon:yes gene_type:complete